MALDGLSNQSVGIYRTKDSSEKTERLAAKSAKEAEKRVDATGLIKKIDKDGSQKKEDKAAKELILSKARELLETENENEVLQLVVEEGSSSVELEYTLRFNSETKMIEMSNVKNGKLIESVTPEELMKVLHKAKSISGVFIDKKI